MSGAFGASIGRISRAAVVVLLSLGFLIYVHRRVIWRVPQKSDDLETMIRKAKAGDPNAFDELVRVTYDPKADRLQRSGALPDTRTETFLSTLRELLNHPNRRTRLAAATALDALEDRLALPFVEKALGDPFPPVRACAVSRILCMDGPPSMVLWEPPGHPREMRATIFGIRSLDLLERALSDPNARVREVVVGVLGKMGGERAMALVERALSDVQRDVRIAAVEELARAGDERSVLLVEKAFTDETPDVRAAVLDTFFSSHRPDSAIRDLYLKGLADPHPLVRKFVTDFPRRLMNEEALAALLRLASTETELPVLEMLRRTLSQKRGDPRVDEALRRLDEKFPR